MTVKQRKSMAAFTLVEVMAAILIVTIVVAGGSFLFVMGKGQISIQKRYRAATQLAAQKVEELKAGDYSAIPLGTTPYPTVTLDGLSYSRSINTVDAGNYKKVTVTVSWGPMGSQRNLNLVTCIAPK